MKRWLVLFAVAGALNAGRAAAQTRAADSLRALLGADKRADTLRVRRLQALSGELMMEDVSRAIAVLEQGLALARRLPDPIGEGRALIRLGTLSRMQTDYAQARRYTQQALNLFARRADHRGLATAYLQLSFVENVQSNVAAALQAALHGLPHAEQAGDRVAQTRLQMAIASTYVQLGNYKEALTTLRRSLRQAQALGDKPVVATVYNLMGTTYQTQRHWAQALACFQRSAQLNRLLGDLPGVTSNEVSVSELYAQRGDLRRALVHGRRALATARTSHDAFNLPAAALALARAYLLAGRTDSALILARQGFALSQSARGDSKENLRNASDILAQAYARRGKFAEAYRYQRLWTAYKDSIAGEDTQRKTSALRYGYELDRKQDQITLLTQARQLQAQRAARQRLQLLGLLAGLLGTVLVAGLLGRNIYLKQRTNRALNAKNDQIAHQRDHLDQALTRLKAAQSQLVQSEKMVALAALTAGVAHEIQNPLNFVNNFSEVSLELMAELEEEQRQPAPDGAVATGLLSDLKLNLGKIHQHGTRAAGIVKGMLDHAPADVGQRQAVDLNALARDYLRLAYHSLQTKYPNFTVARTFDLDPALGTLPAVPQELGRVLLNLFTNALYAVHEKAAALGPNAAYAPAVRVRTRRLGGYLELHVRDNGTGIPPLALEKIFDPFFTTKPPGEGTGLGLWLSYDIVTKSYGGTLAARSEAGAYSELMLTLPQSEQLGQAVNGNGYA